jgi:multisubunit Na+/H+ antiporter MnhG subunit
MNTQASSFRAACREQAGLAMTAFARFWGRYAPKGRGRIALRAGCLLFAPFITLFVWLVQGMIWMVISAPILAYALIMAAVGGGFSRDHRQLQPFSRIAPNPPPPPPPPT